MVSVQGFITKLAAASVLLVSMAAGAGVTVLHGFDYDDGEYPEGRLLIGHDGRIYGTTYAGGSSHVGTVFAVGTDKVHTILHSFSGPDGLSLDAGLVQWADGTLFGSTPQGSVTIGNVVTSFGGSVFKLGPDGSGFSTLRTFSGSVPDGSQPGMLVDGGDGYLYGGMRVGGSSSAGTLFKIAPDGALATIYTFTPSVGFVPDRQLTLGSDGKLYGALRNGPAPNADGVLFRIDRSGGAYTQLHAFNGNDGAAPSGALVEFGGAFYGVTGGGGATGNGTVFRLAADGSLSTLHAFNGSDGAGPLGPLALGPDGNLYGLTYGGGLDWGGTIFRISPQGAFTLLHRLVYADGTHPFAGPVMGADGMLFGATTQGGGGSLATGSVFQFDALAPQPAALSLSKACYNEFNTCFRPINTGVGQRYDVFWSSENLSTCVASGAWNGTKPPAGSLSVTPTRPGIFTYRLVCSGPRGIKAASVTVTVG